MAIVVYQCSKCFRALSDSTNLVTKKRNNEITVSDVSKNVLIAAFDIGNSNKRKKINIFCKCGTALGFMKFNVTSQEYVFSSDSIISYIIGTAEVDHSQEPEKNVEIANACEKMADVLIKHEERLSAIEQIVSFGKGDQKKGTPLKRKTKEK